MTAQPRGITKAHTSLDTYYTYAWMERPYILAELENNVDGRAEASALVCSSGDDSQRRRDISLLASLLTLDMGDGRCGRQAVLTDMDVRLLRQLAAYRWRLPWRVVALQAGALWLATRLLTVALTALVTTGAFAQRLARWSFFDARWYTAIARHGYAPTHLARASFFPLLPLLLYPWQSLPTPQERLLADVAVGNLATLAAFVAVGLLAAQTARTAAASWWAILALAVSPLAVFFSGVYSDGLFLALAAGALLAARAWHWRWASVLLALAVIARPFGVVLALALAVEYAQQRGWRWAALGRNWREGALLIGLPTLTLGGFLLVLWRVYGDPLAFLHAAGAATPGVFRWGHGLRWPWQTLALVGHELQVLPHWSWPTAHLLLDLLPIVVCVVVAAVTARRAPVSFTVLTGGVALICLMSPLVMPNFPDPLASTGRYCYAAVPVLIQLGVWMERGWAQRWLRWLVVPLVCASLALQGVLTVFLLRGGWLV